MKIFALTSVAACTLLSTAIAEETRQHDAHEHGAATLMIAQEGNAFELAFETPAFNIVGFEHHAESDEDKAALDAAVRQLNDPTALFEFSSKANCTFTSADVESALLDDEHDEHADEDHADHDEHADEDHDEHEGEDHDEHVEEHEHDDHSDFDVSWHVSCDSAARVTEINVKLFEFFDKLEDLDVEYLTDAGQGAVELSADEHRISLK